MGVVSGSGSGVGTPGAPIQPSVRDLEATAATDVAKAYLKVVADTLDIPLLEMDYDARRYQSASNRPVLANALFSVRVNTGAWPQELSEDVWRPTYEELLQLMPEDFRADFLANLQLPPDQRNPNYVIFDNFLRDTAKALAWLGHASAPVDAESLASFRADVNLVLSYIALNAIIIQSDAFLEDAQAYLATVGPNDPNYDSLNNYLTQYGEVIDDLKRAITLVKDPSTRAEGEALYAETLGRIATLRNDFSQHYAGGDLLIFGSYLNALELITSAVSLKDAGSSTLLIALSIATFGASASDSALGIFGPSFTGTVNGLVDAIITAYLPNADPASSTYLHKMLEAYFTGALIVGFNLYSNGFGLGEEETATASTQTDTDFTYGFPFLLLSNGDILSGIAAASMLFGLILYSNSIGLETAAPSPRWLSDKNFAYGLALLLLTNSEILTTVAKVIVNGISVPPEVEKDLIAVLKMIALMMLILASLPRRDPEASIALMKTMHIDLKDGIDSVSKFVNDALLAEKISGKTAEKWGVFLEQAKIALDHDDYDGFISALEGCFELFGTTLEGFLVDMQGIKTFYKSLRTSLETTDEDLLNTGISTSV